MDSSVIELIIKANKPEPTSLYCVSTETQVVLWQSAHLWPFWESSSVATCVVPRLAALFKQTLPLCVGGVSVHSCSPAVHHGLMLLFISHRYLVMYWIQHSYQQGHVVSLLPLNTSCSCMAVVPKQMMPYIVWHHLSGTSSCVWEAQTGATVNQSFIILTLHGVKIQHRPLSLACYAIVREGPDNSVELNRQIQENFEFCKLCLHTKCVLVSVCSSSEVWYVVRFKYLLMPEGEKI